MMSDSQTNGHSTHAASPPTALTSHPFALAQFPLGAEADDVELIESVREHGVLRPVTVTGERCASPPGVVLNGNRRRRAAIAAGIAAIPVRVLDDLGAIDEERIVLAENLADQQGRRLTESQRAAIENELAKRLSKGQGYRSDICTSAGSSGGVDTRDSVAAVVGATRNSVADRKTIFSSPVSPNVLKQAVDAGKITRTRAATIVREAERIPGVAAVDADADRRSAVIENAKVWVERQLKAASAGKVNARKEKHARTSHPKKAELDLRSCPTEVLLSGRRLRVELHGERLHVEDAGPAYLEQQSESAFGWPPKAHLVALTATNWIHAVHRAVAFFPDDLRADISIREPVWLPREECPGCAGTVFSRDEHACIVCNPGERRIQVVNLRSPREQIVVGVNHPAASAELAITYWTSGRDAGLDHLEADYPTISVGDFLQITIKPSKVAYFKSISYLCDETWKMLHSIMNRTHGLKAVETEFGRPQKFLRADGSDVQWRDLPDWVSFARCERL
jgi:hypothetical protein